MSEYSHCSICGGSFIGIGNVCPGCEDALSREPLEIRPIELKTRRNSADEAERAKMPRVGHGDKFYVVPYKESEVAE